MNIKLIKTKRDYEAAVKRIEKLMVNPEQNDELEILGILVDEYESKHFPIDAPDPIEAIRFRMDQLGLIKKDLAPIMGGRNRVTEIMNGQRRLTVKMIRLLAEEYDIPTDALVGVGSKR